MEYKKKDEVEEKLYKEPTYRSIGSIPMYAIFRVGTKHRAMISIRNFQKHMEREIKVKNANPSVQNEILIGNSNIYEDVSGYLQGVKLKSNSVLAREVLLTASPSFFKGLSTLQLEQWKAINKEWLIKEFGENIRYAVLHKDESTWHIHAIIVPKFYDYKKECYILSNSRYFDGKEKLRHYQDIYASSLQTTFKQLTRGVKYSKAKHIDIKTFYNLVNKELDVSNTVQLIAKAKNSDLQQIKIKSLQETIEAYKKYNRIALQEKDALKKENEKLQPKFTDTTKNEIDYRKIMRYFDMDEKELSNVKTKSKDRTR